MLTGRLILCLLLYLLNQRFKYFYKMQLNNWYEVTKVSSLLEFVQGSFLVSVTCSRAVIWVLSLKNFGCLLNSQECSVVIMNLISQNVANAFYLQSQWDNSILHGFILKITDYLQAFGQDPLFPCVSLAWIHKKKIMGFQMETG